MISGAPDLIVADEPTSALDATVQKEILALLRNLTEETGVSILLVTHDMGVVSAITDRVVVMRHGTIVEQGETRSVLDAPERTYTRRLLAAVPKLRLSLPNPIVNANVHSASPTRPDAFTGEAAETSKPPILAARNITKAFVESGFIWFKRNPAKAALRDVSVELERGAITGIVGESGSGKSTIGRARCASAASA